MDNILSSKELELCKQIGAKYITRNAPWRLEDGIDIFLWNDMPDRVITQDGSIYYCSERGNLVGDKMVGMIEVDKVQNRVSLGDCYRITKGGGYELVYGGNDEHFQISQEE